MKILWFTWKDSSHPQAGGAEVVTEELTRRLAAAGHEVRIITAGYPGAAAREIRDGIEIIRLGGRWTVYWRAFRHYRKHLADWPDRVVEEINTIPFFCKFYVRRPNCLFVHQLCREIWFYQMSLPLKLAGYLLEPVFLWLLRDRRTVTVSESTKADLRRFGFRPDRVTVMPQGIRVAPVADPAVVEKFPDPTLLSFGSVRAMKRTAHVVKAFELAKARLPGLRLVVAGEMAGGYADRVAAQIARSPYRDSISCLGKTDEAGKLAVLARAHAVAAASVKEGWCLVVTEAASQGTPAVVYDVDGLRDSVRDGETGLIARKNTPAGLADAVVGLLRDPENYARLQRQGWQWSRQLNFDRSYEVFWPVLKDL